MLDLKLLTVEKQFIIINIFRKKAKLRLRNLIVFFGVFFLLWGGLSAEPFQVPLALLELFLFCLPKLFYEIKVIFMVKCSRKGCNKNIVMPWKCKFCGDKFCSHSCSLPEEHMCEGLDKFKKFAKDELRKGSGTLLGPKAEELEKKYESYREGVNEAKKETTLSSKNEKKNKCSYHLCNEKATVECPFCYEKFCEEHLEAIEPGMPNFKSSSAINARKLEKWRSEVGHPCNEYDKKLEEYKPPTTKKVEMAYDTYPENEESYQETKSVKESFSADFKKKHFEKNSFSKFHVFKKYKLAVYGLIAVILVGLIFWQVYNIMAPSKDEIIFEQANEKCSVFVESFCPTKSVEVEGEAYDCLWNRQEQKCAVWWKK